MPARRCAHSFFLASDERVSRQRPCVSGAAPRGAARGRRAAAPAHFFHSAECFSAARGRTKLRRSTGGCERLGSIMPALCACLLLWPVLTPSWPDLCPEADLLCAHRTPRTSPCSIASRRLPPRSAAAPAHHVAHAHGAWRARVIKTHECGRAGGRYGTAAANRRASITAGAACWCQARVRAQAQARPALQGRAGLRSGTCGRRAWRRGRAFSSSCTPPSCLRASPPAFHPST